MGINRNLLLNRAPLAIARMGAHKRTPPFGLHDRSVAVRRIGVARNCGHSECGGNKQRPSGGLRNANNSDRRLSD